MNTPYFDTHCDTISLCLAKGERLRSNGGHVDLDRARANFSPYAQVFAVFTRPTFGGADYTVPDAPAEVLHKLCFDMIGGLKAEFEANADILTLCLDANDARNAAAAGKIAAFISVEGAELLKCDRAALKDAYDLGVRVVNMCWNFDNKLTGSCVGASNGGGLTDEGREFVKYAGELGVILDMSHISEAAFWDIAEITEKPIIASHSNAKVLCGHPRNLTDDQFKAIVKLGGVAGLNLYPDFLGECEDMGLAHVERFLSLGGEKTACIGGDLDGVGSLPPGIEGVQDVGKLYEAMLRRGWSEDLVRDIFYNNALACFERALG